MANINLKGRLIDDSGNALATQNITFTDVNAVIGSTTTTTNVSGYWTKTVDERGEWKINATVGGKTREQYGGAKIQLAELSVSNSTGETARIQPALITTQTYAFVPEIVFNRADGTSAAPVAVASGVGIGRISFYGSQNATPDFRRVAEIVGKSEGTATNPLPGSLEFYTSSAGVADLMRMRIDSVGRVFFRGGNSLVTKLTLKAVNAAAPATYLAADLLGGIITRDCAGAGRADTTDTAANIIAALSGQAIGDCFECDLINISAVGGPAETITLSGGGGVTLKSTSTTIVEGQGVRLLFQITGAATLDLYIIGN